ncbi:hypothetical protein VZT92_026668, partial [Zoarces viviparus]
GRLTFSVSGTPPRRRRVPAVTRQTPEGAPQSPARTPRRTYAQGTRAARRDRSPPAAAPAHAGPTGAPPRPPRRGRRRRERGNADGGRGEPDKGPRTAPGIPKSALRGTKAGACDCPNRGDASVSD